MTEEKTAPEEETVSIPLEPAGIIALMRRIAEDAIMDVAQEDSFLTSLNLPQILGSPQALMAILVRLKVTELAVLSYAANATGKFVADSADGLGVTKDMCEIVAISTCVYNEMVDKEIAKKLYPAIRDLDECPVLEGTTDDESPEKLVEAARHLKELLSKIHLPNYQ